jgi:hypothetical protein
MSTQVSDHAELTDPKYSTVRFQAIYVYLKTRSSCYMLLGSKYRETQKKCVVCNGKNQRLYVFGRHTSYAEPA